MSAVPYLQFAGACAYSIQIYTDFSGYSWMAIAVAKLFGFHLDENFRQPYFAVSISDFWHRWHISLTSWFTEYLYFPLGGNRKGKARRFLNIFIVFLVSGLARRGRLYFGAYSMRSFKLLDTSRRISVPTL